MDATGCRAGCKPFGRQVGPARVKGVASSPEAWPAPAHSHHEATNQMVTVFLDTLDLQPLTACASTLLESLERYQRRAAADNFRPGALCASGDLIPCAMAAMDTEAELT